MDGPWPQDAVYLFAMALPLSMFAWVWLARAEGWVQDPSDQPAWFRFIVARSSPVRRSGRAVLSGRMAGILGAIAFWCFVNLVPIWLLLLWPYGWLGRLVALGYFVAQAIWANDLRRAIVRARSRPGGE